ncbi:MAG: carbonate dehydratase [Alphaproteobacteria bacterium]|nr:carbonate dehydratase [Alphaproteobacteria bacterium]
MHDRRSTLRLALGAAAALCPLCRVGGAEAAEVHWTYEGERGPPAWGKLSPEFQACSNGREQTPIDLKDAIRAEPGLLSYAYKRMPVRALNNGHTIQINCPAGSQAQIAGQTFELLQYHFHHPSEHVLAGQRFQLELHLVHRNKAGELAVIGVFIRAGQANQTLQSIWSVMPTRPGPEKWTSVSVNPDRLLPANSTYFRYYGSLTTPPCSEGVLWTVYREPIEASEAQIRQFAQIFPNNARPVQPLNRRFLLGTL